jgi:hypothetical protein
MLRSFMIVLASTALLTLSAVAQDGIAQGKIKKFDADKKIVTITSAGQDRDYPLTDATMIRAGGQPVADPAKALREGVDVKFKLGQVAGNTVLVGILVLAPVEAGKLPDTSGLKPLPELGRDKHHGFEGGLYPDGKNERPAAHEKAGLALARKVQPLDADGKPSPDGKIVLLTIGMSNTSQATEGFQRMLRSEPDRNPRLVVVNGSVGGMVAAAMAGADPNGAEAFRRGDKYWKEMLPERLKQSMTTAAQVQVVWIKQADGGPTEGFPRYAEKLQAELEKIVRSLPGRFPNLRLVYLSSRTYGGYAKTLLNPDPYAYESGFAVKWLIEKQLKGDPALAFDGASAPAPWLSWGPYLWANGATKRADGFSYEPRDFAGDGTHLTASGQDKVGRLLVDFFKTDSTTRSWFLRPATP